MKRNIYTLCVLLLLLFVTVQLLTKTDSSIKEETIYKPLVFSEHDDEDDERLQDAKVAPWSAEKAAIHQKLLEKHMPLIQSKRGVIEYANGALLGEWRNRGAKNMPGAFKFAEMLDGTDTVYGVTHNHYSGEYNSKSYIFKGTIYNPKSGTKGDDFVRLTGHWPNRYQNLIVLKVAGKTRLVAAIENGPLYWSDDQGKTWTLSMGLPSVLQSSTINRQDSNKLYSTDGKAVYVSNDGGETFALFETFSASASSALYSPRYSIQPNADELYLVRSGGFYTLEKGASSFLKKGTYTSSHGTKNLSIGGDSRKLYVTENSNYWVSSNGGESWVAKYPKGNWYGDRTGKMSAGKFLCVNPENADNVIGGYAQPVFSTTGLDSDVSTTAGWGGYQNGTSLGVDAYHNRIRFNYHPDFQASHFFYNSTGDLFSVHCTDGGLYMSYKVWSDHSESSAYDNSGYNNAHFINITTLNTTCPLIYRDNLFTGYKDETHIIYSTQDQGTQSIIPGTTGELLDFYQSIGGDGPPLKSVDGRWVWKWQREGGEVFAPVEMYDASGNMRSAATINGLLKNSPKASFTKSSNVGWVQTYIDRNAPDIRMWLLGKRLDRVTVQGGYVATKSISKGTGHQVCALAQASENPNLLWFLQEGKVYKSTDRGDSFDAGTETPFSKTSNKQNMGSGWVLPSDDNWILFTGPSSNGVGAILSKDGGVTWKDVTGDFPIGDDFQSSTMEGTPDGKYVFVGTDIGPWVFIVATEEWYPIGEGAAYFNAMDMEYIASTHTMRFGSWGSGVWDFKIQDGIVEPFIAIKSPNGGELYEQGDTVSITWNSFLDGEVSITLFRSGQKVQELGTVEASVGAYNWIIDSGQNSGRDYSVVVQALDNEVIKDESDTVFTIQKMIKLDQVHLQVISTDSEEANRPASNTIDGDEATFWHTEWSQTQPDFPHEIIFSCDTMVELAAIEYTGRQDGNSNGHVMGYRIELSKDGDMWETVLEGSFTGSGMKERVLFDTLMSAERIKFVALSEANGNFYASASEINLFYVGGETGLQSQMSVDNTGLAIKMVGKSMISVPLPANATYTLRVYSTNGRIVYSGNGMGAISAFDLNRLGLAHGIYVVKVSSNLGSVTQRIRVQ